MSALMLYACAHSGASAPPVQAPEEDTTLGSGDVFEVRVFGEKDLTGKYQVGPDGTINYPFLGNITVAGKEAVEVANAIRDGLKNGQYLLNPSVSVFVEQSNSKRISVLGAVGKPGTQVIVPGLTVVQAVSNSGGFTPLASKDDTVVTRRLNGKLEKYRIPVTEITRGNAEDFPLRAGDIVFVPERVF
ncbi:MAG: polysaccharide biosynthesis/export family protein [Myxococcales bacterium]